MVFRVVKKSHTLKRGKHITDEIPIIFPEKYIIRDCGNKFILSDYLYHRFECVSKTYITHWDFSDVLGVDFNVEISKLSGNIHFDTDFREVSEKGIVGHMQIYHIKSDIPGLINPKTVADLCIGYSNEDYAYAYMYSMFLNQGKSLEKCNIPSMPCRAEDDNLNNYLFGFYNRTLDKNSTKKTYDYPADILVAREFYCWLESKKIKKL